MFVKKLIVFAKYRNVTYYQTSYKRLVFMHLLMYSFLSIFKYHFLFHNTCDS
jgi:hypothetical protein